MTIHSENRIIRHTPEQLFQLVADVQHYPAFLPWCLASRVKTRSEDKLVADLIIGFQMFR
ncbi:MAG: SRPBCC family protein, partial [Alphaproteobacteria bacterium]|nr:SRPBCC family protein [Alphaproteobacteria bacterium]